ncbi:hypothetical protein ABII15_01195 [Streptomyces sp. HUAS MG91]|uniref:Alkaline shock response membrane anchor protein AmaP n=1 Tax=Streptomyces tabacisoli TaxID=3156398 RepID=A0AAU8IJY7_9ACTN
MPRSRTILNRLALAVLGAVLLAAALWLSAGRTSWAPELPDRWPLPDPHTSIVPAGRLGSLRESGWWTPTVMTVSIVATLLLAYGTVRQLRGGFRRLVPLPAPHGVLRTRALEDALARRATAVDGVAHCRARTRVRRRRLDVVLRVRLREDTSPHTVLPALTGLARETETVLSPYRLRLHIRLTSRSHRRPHVR